MNRHVPKACPTTAVLLGSVLLTCIAAPDRAAAQERDLYLSLAERAFEEG